MGEKWLTSGRARIQVAVKRRRGGGRFAANAMARGVLTEHSRPPPRKTSNIHHQRQNGNLRANYSAYADPLLRRAVVGTREQEEDDEENHHRRPRIRDPLLRSRVVSHYNPKHGRRYANKEEEAYGQHHSAPYYDYSTRRDPNYHVTPFVDRQVEYAEELQQYGPPNGYSNDNNMKHHQVAHSQSQHPQDYLYQPHVTPPQEFDSGPPNGHSNDNRNHYHIVHSQLPPQHPQPQHPQDYLHHHRHNVTPPQELDSAGENIRYDDGRRYYTPVDGGPSDAFVQPTQEFNDYDILGGNPENLAAATRPLHDVQPRETVPFSPQQPLHPPVRQSLPAIQGSRRKTPHSNRPPIFSSRDNARVRRRTDHPQRTPSTGIPRFQRRPHSVRPSANQVPSHLPQQQQQPQKNHHQQQQQQQQHQQQPQQQQPQKHHQLQHRQHRQHSSAAETPTEDKDPVESFEETRAKRKAPDDEIIREFQAWKQAPQIRFFNESLEVDADNNPIPELPEIQDDLGLLGKKSFWE